MTRTAPYEAHAARYDAWFDQNQAAYVSELLALRPFVPVQGLGLEVGVGTGRFAAPLGVRVGLDPARAMLARAHARGIEVVQAAAESLPFADDTFDHALAVTTICFVDSPLTMLGEARRVLKPGGRLVIGFIDRSSELGRFSMARRRQSVFYADAIFYSAAEVEALLLAGGYGIESCGQTLSGLPAEVRQIEPLQPGHGNGGFVVVAARSCK